MMRLAVISLLMTLLSSMVPAYADDPLFPADPQAATPLQVELRLPLRTLLKVRPGKVEEFDASLLMADGESLPLRVSPRGKSRRQHCTFPPLWLEFDKTMRKKADNNSLFAGQKKLKLVTHCAKKFADREYLASEMLSYRLLNLLTDQSFRVRAVQINYVDTQRDHQEQRYGFLIEHKKRLAKRLNAKLLDTPNIKIKDLHATHTALIGLFEYMLGNTDFSMRRGPGEDCCHNAVPFSPKESGEDSATANIITVPYDFDVAGLVNPPYATPPPNLKIRRVTQRLYRGYCEHNELLPAVVENFVAKKAEILSAVAEFDDIPGLKRERLNKYLSAFFSVIESEDARQAKLIKRCR